MEAQNNAPLDPLGGDSIGESLKEQMEDQRQRAGDSPLVPVVITAQAQETLVLRILARQAIPMLLQPGAFTEAERSQLALTLHLVLEHECGEGAMESMGEEFEEAEDPP